MDGVEIGAILSFFLSFRLLLYTDFSDEGSCRLVGSVGSVEWVSYFCLSRGCVQRAVLLLGLYAGLKMGFFFSHTKFCFQSIRFSDIYVLCQVS